MKNLKEWIIAGIAVVCVIAVVVILIHYFSPHDGRQPDSTEVLIETSEGDILVRLFDDTPLHRDNFLRNVEAHAYDNRPFHRIVPDMVIQAGAAETDTSEAPPTIPAEILCPPHFHRQGALAAAREPDSINPDRRSSALQWYIVTGKTYTSAELSELQVLMYEARTNTLFEHLCGEYAFELARLKEKDYEAYQELLNKLLVEAEETMAKTPPHRYSHVQRETYARIGGAPHLDGEYTVFGEVIEGMPVALRIGRTPVDANEHPRRNVYIKRVTIVNGPE